MSVPIAAGDQAKWEALDMYGACRKLPQYAKVWFFPKGTKGVDAENTERAKAICAQCPARNACLDLAVRNHEIGVWGGTTEQERTEIRKQISRRSRSKSA